MIVLVVLGMLWARRPRWHRTPALAAHAQPRTWSRPFVTAYAKPGVDPALEPLALLGGDHAAHVVVHGGAGRVREPLTYKETQ